MFCVIYGSQTLLLSFVVFFQIGYKGDFYLENSQLDLAVMTTFVHRQGYDSLDPARYPYCRGFWQNEKKELEPRSCIFASGPDISKKLDNSMFITTRINDEKKKLNQSSGKWDRSLANNTYVAAVEEFHLGLLISLYNPDVQFSSRDVEGWLEVTNCAVHKSCKESDAQAFDNKLLAMHKLCKESDAVVAPDKNTKNAIKAPCFMPASGKNETVDKLGSKPNPNRWKYLQLADILLAASLSMEDGGMTLYPDWTVRDLGRKVLVLVEYSNRKPFQVLPDAAPTFVLKPTYVKEFPLRTREATHLHEHTQVIHSMYGIEITFTAIGTLRAISISKMLFAMGSTLATYKALRAAVIIAAKNGLFGQDVQKEMPKDPEAITTFVSRTAHISRRDVSTAGGSMEMTTGVSQRVTHRPLMRSG